MVLVNLPMPVKIAHLCYCIVLGVMFLLCFVLVFKNVCGGYLLFYNIVL
jgi:hypothetical protein